MSDVLIELKSQPGQGLGIGFDKDPKPPYCRVKALDDNGAAYQSGKVQIDDLLLTINGRNVQNIEPEQMVDVMARFKNDTTFILELRRSSFLKAPVNDSPRVSLRTPSPDEGASTSPGMRRPRRSGGPPALSDIQEGRPAEAGHLGVPGMTDKKRHSLTPESQRKTTAVDKLKISKSTSLDLANLSQWRKATGQPISLEYLVDGSELVDRLHNQETKVTPSTMKLLL